MTISNSTTAALFFDIDGTLISDKTNKIPRSTIDALQLAKDKGHLLFINSGRTICAIRPELKAINFDGFLCGCGTFISYHGQVLFKRSIDETRGNDILDKMQACNVDCIVEGSKDIYFPRHISRFADMEKQRNYYKAYFGLAQKTHIEDRGFIFDKLFARTDEKSDKQAFFDFLSEDMDIIDCTEGRYEIVPKGCSKAAACDYIVKKLGIAPENTYVFGDSTNDMPMFQYARHAVAMGCHDKTLEPYTEFITKDVEEDGIAHALKHYGLI